MKDEIKIFAESQPWHKRVNLFLRAGLHVAEPVVLKKITPENELDTVRPMLTLTIDEAQHLMDSLWSSGLRPTEGSGSAGSLAATERHLKDLQRLVFQEKEQQTPVRTY